MFSQFLSILTCLAMLWHSIGGCCWHHDHADCDAKTACSESGDHHRQPDTHEHDYSAHNHHADHQPGDEDSHSPAPCNHSGHCAEEVCVYVKTFTPDVTSLFHLQAVFVAPAIELPPTQAAVTLRTMDRVVLHREELSAQHHCALTQSWVL